MTMQVLKLSVSLPDAEHPDLELRLSANDSTREVVIALPVRRQDTRKAGPVAPAAQESADDDYVLGGYAGI